VLGLLLPVGADLYAVPAGAVREVVTAPRLTRLPGAPAAVLGLFNLRGEIVPLFDVAGLLGIGHTPRPPYAAVVRTGLRLAGLGATRMPSVVALDDRIGSSELAGTAGSFALDTRLVVELDIEALLEPA
jgi:purine-binding chemotaxis protein CheW